MRFFITDFFSKCDRIRSFLRIWSHLLKKSLMENFIFCTVLFIKDLVFFIQNSILSIYADGNHFCISGEGKSIIKSLLSSVLNIVKNWFYESYMLLNPEKCHFMFIGKNVSCEEVEILGVTIHLSQIYFLSVRVRWKRGQT